MYNCSCGRTFGRLLYLQRHRTCCELLRETKHVRERDLEQRADVPPLSDIWFLLQEVVEKLTKIEAANKELEKWVKVKKRRLDAIKWLDDNCSPPIDYPTWLAGIKVNQTNLNLIFEYGFISGVLQILELALPLDSEIEHPLRGFAHKPNVLFVYSETKWAQMTLDQFKSLICKLHLKIHLQFKKWCDANQTLINDVHNNDEWHRNTQKVMGGSLNYVTVIKKLHKLLYNYIKSSLHNVTEYSFS